ncbi:MFS transporter, FSR family, fosmidomycin resistance protein [Herbiconiux ginsengi]|uniref:MFS transporter, FSR family, fosmidomycin resistance protein n=1 Tax=Herbiconiux ginsengi TaxID=381665 RepID=A0A1H3QFC9_9MICO|nr:MFS transporter, FSR family, fosmidomycin resistance protein [Herbiconiux ginsengi]
MLEQRYDYAAVAGITLAATSLSSVAQPAFGLLSDRFASRWLILAGMAVAATGIALSGMVSGSYWLTWVVIALSGIGIAAYHPAATMAAREAGGGSNRSMSMFSVGGNVGVALAPTGVILTVGTLGLGATPLLAIPAAVMVVVYLLRMRAVRMRARRFTEPVHNAARAWATGPHDGSSRSAAVEPAVEIALEEEDPGTHEQEAIEDTPPVRDDWRAFAWLTLVLAFWSVAYVGVSSFISLFQIQQFGIDEAAASIALTVFPAAGAAGTLAGGFLADRWGRMRTIRTGYITAALGAVAIVLAPNTVVVVAATAVVGFTLFLPFAPQITLSHSYLPNRVGTASGLTLGLTLSLGGFLNPLLGLLADHTTVQTVFALIVLLLAVGFALSFILRERMARVLPVAAR